MSTPDDEVYMARALQLAQRAAQVGEVPVGAVIVYDNRIIAEGYNQPIATHDPSAHAEIVAIRQAAQHLQNYRLLNTTLYVTLEPCSMCCGAMIHARIARCVYATADPKTGAIESVLSLLDEPRWNHKVSYTGGVSALPAKQLLHDFFQARR